MDNAANWIALAPDGVTPSAELGLTDELIEYRYGPDKKSGRLTASAGAANHTLQRSLPNLDLTSYDELRLWLKSSRAADNAPAKPFYLQVRLGSAAMGLADIANTWRRDLPVAREDSWDLVRLSLDDLPIPVRNAVNIIQFRCTNAATSWVGFLDDLQAVREEMIGDIDAAMLALLHNQFHLGGNPVPAVIFHPENPPVQAGTAIRILQYDIQYVPERTTFSQIRGDYSSTGFRMHPVSIRYDVYYAIDVYAETRLQKTQIMEFILHTLSPRAELLINDAQQMLEWVTVEPLDETGKWRSDRELLYFKVAARQEVGAIERVTPPYANLTIVSDQRL